MSTPERFAIAVPSGQDIRFLDVISDAPGTAGATARYRFVAPAIARPGGSIDFDTAVADMLHLCQNYVMPQLDQSLPPRQIVISLSDRPLPFGQPAPEATQFFEAYRLENGRCIWEAF